VPVGAIRRVNISTIVSSSTSSLICSIIAGVPNHKIENIKLTNILLQHSGGGTKIDAANRLDEKEREYPEPNMFGNTPAHGLLVRHAEGIEINNCRVICAVKDARPCFLLDDVERADFSNIKVDRAANTPVLILDNAKDIRVASCNSLPDIEIAEAEHKEL